MRDWTDRDKCDEADLPGAVAAGALVDEDDLVDGHDDGRRHKQAADEVGESHSWENLVMTRPNRS